MIFSNRFECRRAVWEPERLFALTPILAFEAYICILSI